MFLLPTKKDVAAACLAVGLFGVGQGALELESAIFRLNEREVVSKQDIDHMHHGISVMLVGEITALGGAALLASSISRRRHGQRA